MQQNQHNSAGSAPRLARSLVRAAWKATLSTLDIDGGYPYGSLVTIATDPDGTPLLLLSGLALHTRNLASDTRASLLVDGTGPGPDALTGTRVTLTGRLAPTSSPTARRRYLARHPGAEMFIDFKDFALYALAVERAHMVAGFGRIVSLDRADMVISTAPATAVIEAEPDILAHMNADHRDAMADLATRLAGRQPGDWHMTGCDPAGIDLVCDAQTARIDFPAPVTTPDEVRTTLIEVIAAARAAKPGPN